MLGADGLCLCRSSLPGPFDQVWGSRLTLLIFLFANRDYRNQTLKYMSGNPTMFVAIPMEELLELIEERIFKGLEKYNKKSSPIQTDELLNVEEACEFLCVSKVTIHKWKKKKLIVSYRIGRRIYFKKHELIKSLH